MRLFLLLCYLLAVISFPSIARSYNVPALAEANALVETAPKKAIRLTTKYIAQSINKERNGVRGDDVDLSLRTPLNVVHAMFIQSQAESYLEQHYNALNTLDDAIELANNHELTMAVTEAYILKAQIYWQGLHDNESALRLLTLTNSRLNETNSSVLINAQRQLQYQSTLLRAQIQSASYNEELANQHFMNAQSYLEHLDNIDNKIDYYLATGEHYLRYLNDDLALDQLISGFWLADEYESQAKIAQANLLLARLYERRKIFDKALQHASAAGDFYESHQRQKPLSQTLTLIASIYEQQRRYNLALVHYFNALDVENQLSKHSRSSQLRLNIARVYWQLYNYTQSEKYLLFAKRVAITNNNENVMAQIEILYGELRLTQNQLDEALIHLENGLVIADRIGDTALQIQGEQLRSQALQENLDFQNALLAQRRVEQLLQTQQQLRNRSEIEIFKGRQRMLERNLKLDELERQQLKQQLELYRNEKVIYSLLAIITVILLYARNRAAKYGKAMEQMTSLQEKLYEHPRSGLRNLRMLNARLSDSLRKTSAHFEQWHLGELINEPLSDRLRFALFDVPQIRQIYIESGYEQGLQLEKSFGHFLTQEICEPARIYHFSDGIFLYIEPNARMSSNPRELSDSIQSLVTRFMEARQLTTTTRIGMAEYPFLPRAYTAINAQELMDILLMTLYAAKKESLISESSEWVHIQAIDAAPAASFVNRPIREACQQGLQNGLLRIECSSNNDISW
ncbi:GGDEF domain-containing protein [Thaumasiovibrio sp. DFM-14]|uniref:GGDEF domain-containing protein n=1 Tax=Thaumasiovibrio sp. DFM-14 TaxID=3384792 RepID=UPI0039A24790